jgi:hypothetical protein
MVSYLLTTDEVIDMVDAPIKQYAGGKSKEGFGASKGVITVHNGGKAYGADGTNPGSRTKRS